MKQPPSFFAQTLRVFLCGLLLVVSVAWGCGVEVEISSERIFISDGRSINSAIQDIVTMVGSLLGFLFIGVSLFFLIRCKIKSKKSVIPVIGLFVGIFFFAVGAVSWSIC